MKKVLVTGSAGFIGFHLSKKLLSEGYQVIGIDNLNDYYDVNLKKSRLDQINNSRHFKNYKVGLEEAGSINEIFEVENPDCVVNLAAQAGVRYSIENPKAYIQSNIDGFLNILEACRHNKVNHLIYASSSSVYGANTTTPFSVHDNVDHPISLYAATKKSNELMAHTYSSLYGLPTTGLRFFTVYGPWGRPDMALFLFTKAILEGKPIQVFNQGEMERDFTFVDDIVEGILRLVEQPPKQNLNWDGGNPDPASSFAPYRIFNVGNNNPVKLMDFIEAIEDATGVKAIKDFLPMQAGDVKATFADVKELKDYIGFNPNTNLRYGIGKFVEWYRDYYKK